MTPNMVTVIGICIGVVAGHFFYYDRLSLNAVGMGLWVISNMFDSADGQLARMTGRATQLGRILDGMGGNFVFFSIYFHICLGYAVRGGEIGWWIFPVALTAGFSHSLQSAMADYYRNAFLRYGVMGAGSELERSEPVRRKYDSLRWGRDFIIKLFYRIYLNYTVQQEKLSPKFQQLRTLFEARFPDALPENIVQRYRTLNKPLLKYYNYMTINGRVLTLFAFVAIGYPTLFFVVEITLLNILLWIVLRRQERNHQEVITMVEREDTRMPEPTEAAA